MILPAKSELQAWTGLTRCERVLYSAATQKRKSATTIYRFPQTNGDTFDTNLAGIFS